MANMARQNTTATILALSNTPDYSLATTSVLARTKQG